MNPAKLIGVCAITWIFFFILFLDLDGQGTGCRLPLVIDSFRAPVEKIFNMEEGATIIVDRYND